MIVASAPLLIWGVVLHLLVDWLAQNEWMAANKTSVRHPAGYVHAGMHGAVQLLVFPWWGAAVIGVAHFLIDLRGPVVWWSKLIRQTQPSPTQKLRIARTPAQVTLRTFDIGTDVRIWADQCWHIGVVALVAVAVVASAP